MKMEFKINLPTITEIKSAAIKFVRESYFFSTFLLLLVLYFGRSGLKLLGKIKPINIAFSPITPKLEHFYQKVTTKISTEEAGNVTTADLIMLAIRNLKAKKTRTFVTIGGMAIGFGAVVFLLSLGYGAQNLVVSRIARLDEMKQADVSVGQAASLFLNSKTIGEMQQIEGVSMVLPMISVVSKTSFNNSVSDVVAYGVTSSYLEQSAIKPIKGKTFENEEYQNIVKSSLNENELTNRGGVVAGISTEAVLTAMPGEQICKTKYSISPLAKKPIYESPNLKAKIIGYAVREIGTQEGLSIWGETFSPHASENDYDEQGNAYGRWVNDDFLIWEKSNCEIDSPDCLEGEFIAKKESGKQLSLNGFITQNEISTSCTEQIKGLDFFAKEGDLISRTSFKVEANSWLPVYLNPKNEEQIIGYTKIDNTKTADLILGSSYFVESGLGKIERNQNGQWLGYWLKANYDLWNKIDCELCEDSYEPRLDENQLQINTPGYIQTKGVMLETPKAEAGQGSVLAATSIIDIEDFLNELKSSSDSAIASGSALSEDGTGWIEMTTQNLPELTKKNVVQLSADAKKVAIINVSMLKLLGLTEDQALDQTFSASFILGSDLYEEERQAESEFADYKIIGVIPGDKTPAFYVPLSDLSNLGVQNYSQLKVVAENKEKLREIRTSIESMGFKTSSVADTVARINGLFDTIRVVLILVGMVALGVAALGMFNTLTVSLLEKTREVGLMKAMGMRSGEVRRLFLIESIIMGFLGGVFGLLLGFALGKLTSFLLSILSVSKGLGVINITHIPPYVIIVVLILSTVIGILTGIFPALRATKISALNALRYE